MFRIGEVERGFIDARGLQDVDVSGEQGKGDGAGDVDARVQSLPSMKTVTGMRRLAAGEESPNYS